VPRRSLILAGGGLKVAFQAGVLQVWLDEAGLTFDHVDGASGGVFNRATHCQGMSGRQIADNWRHTRLVEGVSLNVPIFSGFATRSRVRQAVYNRDATEDQLVQQRRAVTRQTRSAYRALIAGISSIDARTQSVVSAQSALDATEAGFEVGTRTIVDVLQSQQQLYNAQRELSRARHDFLVNTLNLKAAAGTLDVEDIKSVNQHLTVNAEAALAAAETEPLDN